MREYEFRREQAPSLPEDPTEAAETLIALWNDRGGWPTLEKPWEELDEAEREKLVNEIEQQNKIIGWVYEALNDKGAGFHAQIKSNEYGDIYCFVINPQDFIDDMSIDVIQPNAFIILPPGTETIEEGIAIVKVNLRESWAKESVRELLNKMD